MHFLVTTKKNKENNQNQRIAHSIGLIKIDIVNISFGHFDFYNSHICILNETPICGVLHDFLIR